MTLQLRHIVWNVRQMKFFTTRFINQHDIVFGIIYDSSRLHLYSSSIRTCWGGVHSLSNNRIAKKGTSSVLQKMVFINPGTSFHLLHWYVERLH